MNYKELLASTLDSLLEGADKELIAESIEYPPNPQMGDLSLPCFKLSKQLRKAPQAIAEGLKDNWKPQHPAFQRAEAVAGYFNVFLDPGYFASTVLGEVLQKGDRYGSQNIGQGRNIVIDFSSPNIAKTFHIGHLRSTMIGNSIYKIHAFLGYDCIGINHLGDWGTQFGKMIIAYERWGNKDAVEAEGIDELQRLYIKFHDEAETNPELETEARLCFVRLEQGDEETLKLWKWFVEISLKEFEKMYAILGVTFDAYTGESFYNDKMDAIIQELKEKKLLEVDEGAQLVRLEDYNMPPALMVKQDGGTLYHTRDVTAAIYRHDTYNFEKCIYVTDAGQSLHFQQWFKVIELMGYEWADKLAHVPFGKVSLEGAKLSTRKGNVIRLDDLLTQAVEKTREIIAEKNPNLENKEEIARQVGIGAIIFSDLSSNRVKDIVFSWEDALNFDGETGPYVQYTHVRTCSLLRKANGNESIELPQSSAPLDYSLLANTEAQGVVRELYLFKERVEQAMHKLEPSIVSRYLVDLAQSFNRFYHESPILVDDPALRQARLTLVKGVQITLRNGLKLIGLETPEKM
jgi:arginyl-tRNA synthetase